ncbi:MAG TPA: excinuclease ABC subunit UvrA, partial [Verrucomicrobiae bacterium]|nr:excinuclease ABC subunit UvrA [Verrucomicrobiae bacterium]
MLKPSRRPAIRLRGVRHNNLKNFDLDLPLRQLIVITGLSGSGKSSLAFDTLFAEGQRRYIETFSPYARQFFDRMDKPQVDSIEGIPPAIAIEQRNAVRSTRSTVGTMTEICDHMKVLWSHLARLHCQRCGRLVCKDTPGQIHASLAQSREVLITFDVPLSEKLSIPESLALLAKQGYQRLLMDGKVLNLEAAAGQLARPSHRDGQAAHNTALPAPFIRVVQDRVRISEANRARFVEACGQAYHFGKGKLTIWELSSTGNGHAEVQKPRRFSNRFHCAECDLEYREPVPALFSFNHPLGACPVCRGFGRTISIDYDLAVPDHSLTLAQGAVKPWRTGVSADSQRDLAKFCRSRHVPMDVPFCKLSPQHRRWVLDGDLDYGKDEEHEWPRAWYGVKGYFRWLESKAYKMHVRVLLSRYRAYTPCPACKGARFQPETLLYRLEPQFGETRGSLNGLTLADFYALPVSDALALVEQASRSLTAKVTSAKDPLVLVLSEVRSRLQYLQEVGLGYLTLDRPTRSLSGGETERVNLTTCLGTRLVNTLFVLDEPSVGLHPRDTERLVRILMQLRDTGNTVVVVEHEASVMRAADRIIDLGPGHGATGGEVVFEGPYAELMMSESSLTGAYLSGRTQIEIPARRPVASNVPSCELLLNDASAGTIPSRVPARQSEAHGNSSDPGTLRLSHVTRHNLVDFAVDIPLSRFVCVTGVSGSGKSTLVRDALLPALQERLNSRAATAKASDRIEPLSSEPANPGVEEEPGAAKQEPSASSVLTGWKHLGRAVLVDQSILGKTPRSNPAVYTGAFDDIRELFAQSEAAMQRGLNASAFSFNSSQGQCERCRGAGFEKIEMQFLSDVFIRCPDCQGRRYREHILQVKMEGQRPRAASQGLGPRRWTRTSRPGAVSWSIADLLEATVDECVDFLGAFADARAGVRAVEKLKLLQEVGLGYLRLGQPINTLSGGESQRLKLVRHLAESGL